MHRTTVTNCKLEFSSWKFFTVILWFQWLTIPQHSLVIVENESLAATAWRRLPFLRQIKRQLQQKRWRKRAIWKKIYNVDWYIYRQYAAVDSPCVWIIFFSLALKCPFPFSLRYFFFSSFLHFFLKMRPFFLLYDQPMAHQIPNWNRNRNIDRKTKQGLVKNSFSFRYQTPKNRWMLS